MAEKEYIERELIEEFLESSAEGLHGTPMFVELLLHCRDRVKEMPAADVVEVKHGEWFLLDECSNEGVYCSVCTKKVYRTEYANQKLKSNYCPNCGAKMDGERKEQE